jgi:hypothetical protein
MQPANVLNNTTQGLAAHPLKCRLQNLLDALENKFRPFLALSFLLVSQWFSQFLGRVWIAVQPGQPVFTITQPIKNATENKC